MMSPKIMERKIHYLFKVMKDKKKTVEQVTRNNPQYTLDQNNDFYIVGIGEGEVYIPRDFSKNKLLPVGDNFILWVSATFICSYRTEKCEVTGYVSEIPNYKITGRLA